jgi:hypothetical protein
MTENALTVAMPQSQFIAPVADLRMALQAYQSMKDFVAGVLHEGVDFGVIPGAGSKPTLLKPGAEKLSRFFGLAIRLQSMTVTEDWTGGEHGGEPFFFYRYKAQAMRGELVVAEGIGSCSSWEKKYRYRNGERICPKCGKATIIAGKKEFGGGWLCFLKKGGCGAKFVDTAPEIVGQQVGQVVNPDPADVVNTIDKMAQKRAIIAAVLLGCNASEYFTQDIEDYAVGEWHEEPPVTVKVEPTTHPKAEPIARTAAEQRAFVASAMPGPSGDAANDDLDANIQREMDTDTPYNYPERGASLGKKGEGHNYPAAWVREIRMRPINEYEADAILQKERPDWKSTPEQVLAIINAHIEAKAQPVG